MLAFSPAVAYADAGTPLIWAGAFHLLIGNAIIGIAEGLLLSLLFRLKRARCIPIMIAANYFSAWAGGVFLASTIAGKLDLDLYDAWRWLWYMVAITYFLTLLLEWPFVALCLRKTDGWFRKSIWGSLIVQSASYLVLFGLYWAASGTSLYTDLAVVQPSEISFPKSAMLYYVGENNRDVYAKSFSQEDTRKVFLLTPSENSDLLYLRESRAAPGRWDLIAGLEPKVDPPDPQPSDSVVSAGLACTVAEPPRAGLWPGGEVPRFHDVDKSGWQFQFGWMAGSLDGWNAKDGRKLDVSLDTPFLKWSVQYPTQLPSGQVVFQLGGNQICILDPNERKIALLANGRSPVITMKDSPK
jgi:hypothetical protein